MKNRSCRMPLLASGEVSGFQVPGAIASRCWAGLLRGTYERCRGESTVLTYWSVFTDESPTVGWKLLDWDLKVRRFYGLLRWSVGRHWLLRSRWTTLVSGHAQGNQPVTLIAFQDHNQGDVAILICLARRRMDLVGGTPTHQKSRCPKSASDKAQHNCQNNCAECQSLQPLALKGQARHRLTWRRLCLPCQASAIYES